MLLLSLHYNELIGKTEEHEEKNLIVDDYILNKVLREIKVIIGKEKFDSAKILKCFMLDFFYFNTFAV